jgi:uncharacterized membrane protein YfcA
VAAIRPGPAGSARGAAGAAAVFILLNSIAGLLGNIRSVDQLPAQLPLFAVAALLGALIGTTLAIRLPVKQLLRALGLVLIVAGAKMIGVY